MSTTSTTTNVIATASNDLQALSTTILIKQNALETALNALGPAAQKLLADATADGVNAFAAASGIAASVTASTTGAIEAGSTGNITQVGVDIEGMVVEVSTAFQAVFNFVKGAIEGLKGQNAPAGASDAEQEGDTLGGDVRTLGQALEDGWNNLVHGTPLPTPPSNPSGAVGGT